MVFADPNKCTFSIIAKENKSLSEKEQPFSENVATGEATKSQCNRG